MVCYSTSWEFPLPEHLFVCVFVCVFVCLFGWFVYLFVSTVVIFVSGSFLYSKTCIDISILCSSEASACRNVRIIIHISPNRVIMQVIIN